MFSDRQASQSDKGEDRSCQDETNREMTPGDVRIAAFFLCGAFKSPTTLEEAMRDVKIGDDDTKRAAFEYLVAQGSIERCENGSWMMKENEACFRGVALEMLSGFASPMTFEGALVNAFRTRASGTEEEKRQAIDFLVKEGFIWNVSRDEWTLTEEGGEVLIEDNRRGWESMGAEYARLLLGRDLTPEEISSISKEPIHIGFASIVRTNVKSFRDTFGNDSGVEEPAAG